MSKKYLKIRSFGEIENNAFTLIGASSKRNDIGKIGYFGSGLKYSISALLRNNISFKVFGGNDEIVFETKNVTLRDETHTMIIVNGNQTSLTTGMGGKDWDIAFAPIREIYSNALDEDNDATIEEVTELEIHGSSGYTTFFLEMTNDVKHFYDNIELYFCTKNKNVLFSNEHGSLYPKSSSEGLRIYRKGILCHSDDNNKSIFTYNLTNISISESRVLQSIWEGERLAVRLLKDCTSNESILALLDGIKGGNAGKFEHGFDWDNGHDFSLNWFEVFSKYKFVPVELVGFFTDPSELSGRIHLPLNILQALKIQFKELDVLGLNQRTKSGVNFIETENPSEILTDKVIDAIEILNNTRYKHRLENIVIKYGQFTKDLVLGQASEGNILLSTKLDSYDVPAIAKIIIEENEHNKTGYADKTRLFQDHLFNLYYDELTARRK